MTYTATVSPVPDGGTVAFSDDGAPIAGCGAQQVDTSTGTATCPEPFNTTGPHPITASYSGDQNFTASTGSLTETVGQAVTTTTVTSSANPAAVGQTVTYTATVSPVPDGGTVAFSDDGAPIAGCSSRHVDTSTGTATCEMSDKIAGPHPITAAYSGDTAFTASTGSLTETVGQAVTTTTVTSSANPAAVGQTVTYTATVSPVPDGGTVAFSDDGAPIAGCSSRHVDTSTGTATCEMSDKIAGPHPITAAYSGDTAFTASTGSLTETVGQAVTTTTVTSSANPAAVGQTVTYTATVSPVPDGGTVAFSDDGAPIAGCSSRHVDTSTGTATCEMSYKIASPHPITASYSGDQNFTASTGSLTETVN